MLRASLKSLFARKIRLILTVVAIVIGVSFMAGTFVLTDTMNAAFDEVFTSTTEGIDVVVRGESQFQQSAGPGASGGDDREPIPEEVVAQVAGVDGVARATGEVGGYAQFVDPATGEPIGGFGPPTLGSSWDPDSPILELRQGSSPDAPDEVAIDARTAEAYGFDVGATVEVLLQSGPQEFTVSGIVGFGEADNLAGATLALFDLETAQDVLDREGVFDSISVVAAEGADPDVVRVGVQGVLPGGFEAVSGTSVAQESADQLKEGLGFFRTALLVFAFVALFVGAFIIFNTFSIIVAQRTRELGLLRALGASRRQVLVSTILEAIVVGIVASAIGVVAGVGIAIGLKAVLSAVGIDIPSTATQLEPRTFVVSIVVGLVITGVSAILPARRAASVTPIEALREAPSTPKGAAGRRVTIGVAVTVIGAVALLYGLFGAESGQLELVGLGVLVTFLGVAMLAPLVARPLAGLIGAPLRGTGIAGRLARENAMRNPRRTAATASALMIGVALVVFVAILGASLKASSEAALEETMKADLIVLNTTFLPIPTSVAEDVEGVTEVSAVTQIRQDVFQLDGAPAVVNAVDPETIEDTTSVEMTAGSVASLADGAALVSSDVASDRGWTVGDIVPMRFARTGLQRIPIGGLFEENPILNEYVISLETFDENYVDRLDSFLLVKGEEGVRPAALAAAVETAVGEVAGVDVQDQAAFRETQAGFIDQLLNLITALLSLAIVIALFGIANTLSLSIYERTRELGLLRAVGMTRGQLRSMVRWEAVIIAILGALLGVVLGILFGWALQQALVSEGITELAIPGGQLVFYVLFAALAGVLTALFPARRAAKLKILDAIAYE
ncbi:MAG: FtsX-like permease family protein [Actinomycetota bacterium]